MPDFFPLLSSSMFLISVWLKYLNCNASMNIKVKELPQTFRNLLSLQLTAFSLRISFLKYPLFYKSPFFSWVSLIQKHMSIALILCFLCYSNTLFLSTLFFTSVLFQIINTNMSPSSTWENPSSGSNPYGIPFSILRMLDEPPCYVSQYGTSMHSC